MADFTPTPSQREAVENRGGALLVSAAAGSGKTRVLTERLISYVTADSDPAELDDFLVITYTRSAAAELRSRIGDELAERVAGDPSARRLRRQTALLQRAHIGTIHSFCSSLLREHCQYFGISPDFAIADEDKCAALKRLALERVMNAAYENPDSEFLALSDTVGAGRDDRRLAELILTLYEKIQCSADPDEWFERQLSAITQCGFEIDGSIWALELLGSAKSDALYWAGQTDSLLAMMSAADYAYILKAYGPSISETSAALREFAGSCDRGWDAARGRLPILFPRLGSIRNPPDAEAVEFIKARRDSCKKAMETLAKSFDRSSEDIIRDTRSTSAALRALLKLVRDFSRGFETEKRRRSLVDYADLEHLCARLLTEDGKPTRLADEISARFREVMVDEYQDVSKVQELIINAVSAGSGKLFMVGDVKQSVYRFRLADPNIFIEKYLSYKNASDALPNEPRRVLLRENFRSSPEVLDAVNAVFRNLMSRELGELPYDDDAALRPGLPRDCPGAVPELIALALPDAAEDEGERPDKVAFEAAFVAKKIAALVNSRTLLPAEGGTRPVGYGDIAILLRSSNVAGGIYRRELLRAGVPVLSEQAGGFFDSPEIAVLLSLLAVIDNPHQDVPLIAALRSPLFGFTADRLSAIRSRDRSCDFFSALSLAAEDDAKCAEFLRTLSELRLLTPDLELGALISELYSRLDCMALSCAATDGAAERENLTLLFSLARRFESGGWRGLHRFLGWLRSMQERGEEPGAGGSFAGGAVRIMSIHKSKGLEFPVVFYCNTARNFNKSDKKATVLVHPVLGLGPKLTDTERGVEYPTISRRAIAQRMEREALSEELRLIYVAMTRARERLFITCALPDPDAVISKLARSVAAPMAPEELRTMSCPAKWLICAAMADGEQHLHLKTELFADAPANAEAAPAAPSEPQTPTDDLSEPELAARLDWRYPHTRAAALPSKITATEIKSLGEDDPESASLLPRTERVFRRPDFLRAVSRPSAAEKGTATHLALRRISFAKTGSLAEIEEELQRLCASGYLSEREAKGVDRASILGFFASDIGRRILAADSVLREFPFTLLCPAEVFFPGGGEDELLLQGVADCCIEEHGELTIIDYKTDGVSPERVGARAERYRAQIAAYAYALARVTGKPVRDCVLYFLKPGIAVSMPPKTAKS
ncbi:MAG: UvrD-helicase domain-containing protein [Oscillospiraceae bacterium]